MITDRQPEDICTCRAAPSQLKIEKIRNGVTGRVELVTPPLDSGTVLPGVTRQSVLDLAAEIEGIDVVQRRITLPEVR